MTDLTDDRTLLRLSGATRLPEEVLAEWERRRGENLVAAEELLDKLPRSWATRLAMKLAGRDLARRHA